MAEFLSQTVHPDSPERAADLAGEPLDDTADGAVTVAELIRTLGVRDFRRCLEEVMQ